MTLFRTTLLSLPILVAANLQAQDIPPNVRYKKATPEVNKAFTEMLTDLVNGKIPDSKILGCFDKAIVCGPHLFSIFRQVKGADKSGKPSHFMLPQPTAAPLKMEGRTYNTDADRADFLETLGAIIQLSPMKVRPLTKQEISDYWAIIPWDIEEPIMVAESRKISLLFNANGSKIFFVDTVRPAKRKG